MTGADGLENVKRPTAVPAVLPDSNALRSTSCTWQDPNSTLPAYTSIGKEGTEFRSYICAQDSTVERQGTPRVTCHLDMMWLRSSWDPMAVSGGSQRRFHFVARNEMKVARVVIASRRSLAP